MLIQLIHVSMAKTVGFGLFSVFKLRKNPRLLTNQKGFKVNNALIFRGIKFIQRC